jgi:hypothetical protein
MPQMMVESNLVQLLITDKKTPEGIAASSLLSDLVQNGRLFCPVSLSVLLELFLQEYDSALRQAQVMEELSLNVTFRLREEVWEAESRHLIESFSGMRSQFLKCILNDLASSLLCPVFSGLS